MAFTSLPTRSVLRAVRARPVLHQAHIGCRGIHTEPEPKEGGGQGLGGAGIRGTGFKLAIVSSTLLVGGTIFTMLSQPEKVAANADKVNPAAGEIQRKVGAKPGSRQ